MSHIVNKCSNVKFSGGLFDEEAIAWLVAEHTLTRRPKAVNKTGDKHSEVATSFHGFNDSYGPRIPKF